MWFLFFIFFHHFFLSIFQFPLLFFSTSTSKTMKFWFVNTLIMRRWVRMYTEEERDWTKGRLGEKYNPLAGEKYNPFLTNSWPKGKLWKNTFNVAYFSGEKNDLYTFLFYYFIYLFTIRFYLFFYFHYYFLN